MDPIDPKPQDMDPTDPKAQDVDPADPCQNSSLSSVIPMQNILKLTNISPLTAAHLLRNRYFLLSLLTPTITTVVSTCNHVHCILYLCDYNYTYIFITSVLFFTD